MCLGVCLVVPTLPPATYAMTATAVPPTATMDSFSTMAAPNSTMLFWQYLGTVGSYTLVVIVGLLWVFWQLKKNPAFLARLKGMLGVPVAVAPPAEPSQSLVIEETIQLDADKLLHLVRCEGEKFLMSNGPDGLKLLTKVTSWQETLATIQQPTAVMEDATLYQPQQQSATEHTHAVVSANGDVHLTNAPHTVATAAKAGISLPPSMPKTILGQAVPWFNQR